MFNTRAIVYRATISSVSCLVVPVFICICLLLSCVLKLNDDDDDELRTFVWNSHGQHDYLLIYSCKLKSAFGACQFFSPFVTKRYIQQCLLRSDGITFIAIVTPTLSATTHNVYTGRQLHADHVACAADRLKMKEGENKVTVGTVHDITVSYVT